MSVFCSILSKDCNHSLNDLRSIFYTIGLEDFIGTVNKKYFTFDFISKYGLRINVSEDCDFIQIGNEDYSYKTKFLVELDKFNYVVGMNYLLKFSLELSKSTNAAFVLLHNGEKILLKVNRGELTLNALGDFWKKFDYSMFSNPVFVEYPVI